MTTEGTALYPNYVNNLQQVLCECMGVVATQDEASTLAEDILSLFEVLEVEERNES